MGIDLDKIDSAKAKELLGWLALGQSNTKRQCGKCSLCCKLIPVEPLGKPAGVWCQHCKPGTGCEIYEDRPEACRVWTCEWLRNSELGDEWYPPKSKMVVHKSLNIEDGMPKLVIDVDPGFPGKWREEPWHSQIRKWASIGLEAGRFQTVLGIGERQWCVLPNTEVEIKEGVVAVPLRVGNDEWKVIEFDDVEKASGFINRMNRVGEWIDGLSWERRAVLHADYQEYMRNGG